MTRALLVALAAALATADSVEWTMPTLHSYVACEWADADNPLSDGYRRWELAYGAQSRRWQDSSAVMLRDRASWERNWPTVRAQAEPVVVASGYARPGVRVRVAAPLVISLYWPFVWWVRSWTDVPSRWSNPTAAQWGN